MMIGRTIVSNRIQCLKCGDRPYSSHRHDFKYCKCGSVAVDGGASYLRRPGSPHEYKELSIVLDTQSVERVISSAQEMLDTGRNARGIAYGVIRQLKEEGLLND